MAIIGRGAASQQALFHGPMCLRISRREALFLNVFDPVCSSSLDQIWTQKIESIERKGPPGRPPLGEVETNFEKKHIFVKQTRRFARQDRGTCAVEAFAL
jgi:hypothetical protein